jgi:hypothetical protein
MPEDHQKYLKWNGERFIKWAHEIGPHTEIAIKSILNSFKIEQQGYKSCMGLMKLADKYSVSRLEAACKKALSYTPRPSYKSVKNILATGQDKVINPDDETNETATDNQYSYTRGPGYYGGKHHDE